MAQQMGIEAPRLNEAQQKKWSIVSIAGGLVGSLLWLGYTSLREGKDWGTFLLMIAVPVTLAIFRKPIDRMLLPLLTMRKRIPRLFLIALGLAAPYIVAWLLYNRGPVIGGVMALCFRIGGPLAGVGNLINTIVPGLAEYGYMRWTVVLGPLVAYLIMRTPLESARGGSHGAALATMLISVGKTLLQMILTFGPMLLASACFADDFLRDPLNVRDGLRTPGWAPIIAGTGSSLISVLINGPQIIQTLFPPPSVAPVQPPVAPPFQPPVTPPTQQPTPPTGPTTSTILDDPDALDWLKNHGLVTQNPDGTWTKTGDWGNAVDTPGSGLKGFCHGSGFDGPQADPNTVIIVETPGTQPPPPPPAVKPPEDKPPEDKPPEDKPPEDKPPEDKPPEDKPPEDKPPEDKPPEDKPNLDDPVIAAQKLNDLQNKMQKIIDEKTKAGYYVKNPTLLKKAWNNTIGGLGNWLAGYKGGQCGEFAEWGREWSKDMLKQVYGEGVVVDDIVCSRNSLMNHGATKIMLPNGDRLVLDYWESMPAGKPKIYTEADWISKWKTELGGDSVIQRTTDERFFKSLVNDWGPEKAMQRIRASYKSNPARAEQIINSWRKDPW